jgi:hypothetical protein
MADNTRTLVTVMNTNNTGKYYVAKTILENESIIYYTKNESINFIAEPAGYFEIQVENKDALRAKEALKDIEPTSFSKNINEVQKDGDIFRYIIIAIMSLIIFILALIILN